MPFIDFQALKSALTIEETVGLLGLEMKQAGNQLRGICPACGTTGGRELVVTPDKGAWFCFSEKKGGDLIALAAHIRNESVKDAAAFLADQIGGTNTSDRTVKVTSTSSQEPRQPAPSASKHGFDRAKYQAGLDRTHELLKDIPADFIERADLGVSNKGALKGVVLPLYDKDTGEFLCYVKVDGLQLPKATVTPLKRAS